MGGAEVEAAALDLVGEAVEWQEAPLVLVRFERAVEVEDIFHGAEYQGVAAFGDIHLHAREHEQPVDVERVPRPRIARRDVGVDLVEALRVEVLGQADRVQAGALGRVEQPIGVVRGEGKVLRELAVGMKVYVHERASRIPGAAKHRATHAALRAAKAASRCPARSDDSLSLSTFLSVAA